MNRLPAELRDQISNDLYTPILALMFSCTLYTHTFLPSYLDRRRYQGQYLVRENVLRYRAPFLKWYYENYSRKSWDTKYGRDLVIRFLAYRKLWDVIDDLFQIPNLPWEGTLRHLVMYNAPIEILRKILERDHQIDNQDKYHTALHYAVLNQDYQSVQTLLAWGANPNSATRIVRSTPLHYALAKDNFSIVRLLIEHGANLKAENQFEESSLDIIIRRLDEK